jgi:hypothetical protein
MTMNATTQNQRYALQELEKEALMGAGGRDVRPRSALYRPVELCRRKSDIAEQLWEAAVEIGFFQVSHHGIPLAEIRQAFSMTEAFFALPDEVKRQYPLARNAGWESKAQVRPSTKPDQKSRTRLPVR